MSSANATPLVSVVLPVYDGERYLRESIASVLAQTYAPVELIVVDDGSRDGSGAIARDFDRVTFVARPHAGLAATRNHGVEVATGQFVAFIDADDVWTPTKLEHQMQVIASGVDMVFGYALPFISPDLDNETARTLACSSTPVQGYSACAMLIRRARFLEIGPFDPEWRVGEFIDWYARAVAREATSQMLPEVVFHRRIHRTSMGTTERDSRSDYLRIVKAAMDRRRGPQ